MLVNCCSTLHSVTVGSSVALGSALVDGAAVTGVAALLVARLGGASIPPPMASELRCMANATSASTMSWPVDGSGSLVSSLYAEVELGRDKWALGGLHEEPCRERR